MYAILSSYWKAKARSADADGTAELEDPLSTAREVNERGLSLDQRASGFARSLVTCRGGPV